MIKKNLFWKTVVILVVTNIFVLPSYAFVRGQSPIKYLRHHRRAIATPHRYARPMHHGLINFYYHALRHYNNKVKYVVITPTPVQVVPVATYDNTFVVNIPNSNGSYTAVILRKSGDGYIGPQGEYYPEHPTVDRLRVLYGR